MNYDNKHTPKDFKLPENYFEQFEDRLYTELKFQKLFPNNKDGFLVPDGYFEQVETTILNTNRKQTPVIDLNYRKFAAAVISIAALFAVLFYAVRPTTDNASFEGLSLSNLENYLVEQDRIQDFFSAEELSTIEANSIFLDEEAISDDDLLDYIDSDVVEYELNSGE